MDSLILTFNKEQIKLYNELLETEDISLDFDTSFPIIEEISIYNFSDALSNMEKEALKLLKFKKQSSAFSPFLTQEEIKEFVPIYYEVIRNIQRYKIDIGSKSWILSQKIGEANKISTNINQKYAEFLPYKASLYNREKYALEIAKIDEQFSVNIQKATKYKKDLLSYFDKAEKLCSITSDFFEKSSKATDEPKFKKFDAYDFFWAVEAFIEQLKTIKQKEM